MIRPSQAATAIAASICWAAVATVTQLRFFSCFCGDKTCGEVEASKMGEFEVTKIKTKKMPNSVSRML
jgi:hypothetical protein